MKIFCDLDGTLLDIQNRHYRVYSEVTKSHGGQPLIKDEYWKLKRQKTKWSKLLPLSGLSGEDEDKFLSDFRKLIEDPEYLSIDTLTQGTMQALLDLSKDHSCILVSLRRQPANLHQQLDRLGLTKYFETILSGHSESDGYDVKIEIISKELSQEKDIIIGDTEADIITGQKLGLQTIAVTSGIRDQQFLKALKPDHLVKSFADAAKILQTT